MKGVIAGIVLTFAGALVGAYVLVHSRLIPANADGKPGRLETWAAGTSLDATLNHYAPKP
jgi:thiosulfate dehydrogenase